MRSFGLLPLVVLASACTTNLESRTAGPALGATTGSAPINGWSYRLPRLDYVITITRTLAKCPAGDKPAEVDVEATVTSTYGAGEEIILDYQRLTNGNKTTSVAFENYPNGLLKSVNAQAADQSGPAIKSAVGIAAGIAKLAIGVPPLPGVGAAGGPAGAGWKATLVCTAEAQNLTKSLKALGDDRDKKNKARDEATAALAGFDADHVGDAQPSEKVKSDRAELAKVVREKTSAATDAGTAYAKIKDKLSFREEVDFDANAEGTASDAPRPDMAGPAMSKLLTIALVNGTQKDNWVICPKLTVRPTLADCSTDGSNGPLAKETPAQAVLDDFTVSLTIVRDFRRTTSKAVVAGLSTAEGCSSANKRPCGILYRVSSPARLQLCKETKPSECGGLPAGNANVLVRDERNAPQLGGIRSLLLRNDMFESNSLVAAFAVDGTPVSMTYAKTGAEIPGALAAANDVVGGVGDIDSYNRARGLRSTQNATSVANAEAALADARRKEAEAQLARQDAEAKLEAARDKDATTP